jgi:hypothetical protein
MAFCLERTADAEKDASIVSTPLTTGSQVPASPALGYPCQTLEALSAISQAAYRHGKPEPRFFEAKISKRRGRWVAVPGTEREIFPKNPYRGLPMPESAIAAQKSCRPVSREVA